VFYVIALVFEGVKGLNVVMGDFLIYLQPVFNKVDLIRVAGVVDIVSEFHMSGLAEFIQVIDPLE
jgi:hypothetical protein